MNEKVYLKVKVKSLAEEARIIRKEEKRNKEFQRGLKDHRTGIVREEARHTLLAYGFLRGRSYHQIEHKDSKAPNWDKVKKMVEKYGTVNHYLDNETYAEYTKRKATTLADIMLKFEEWKPKK